MMMFPGFMLWSAWGPSKENKKKGMRQKINEKLYRGGYISSLFAQPRSFTGGNVHGYLSTASQGRLYFYIIKIKKANPRIASTCFCPASTCGHAETARRDLTTLSSPTTGTPLGFNPPPSVCLHLLGVADRRGASGLPQNHGPEQPSRYIRAHCNWTA